MPIVPYKSSKADGSKGNLLLSCTCELTKDMCQSWVCQDATPIPTLEWILEVNLL